MGGGLPLSRHRMGYEKNLTLNPETKLPRAEKSQLVRVRVRVRVRDIQWVFQNEDVFVYKMHDLALSPNLKFKFIHLHEFHNVRCLILVLNCHF